MTDETVVNVNILDFFDNAEEEAGGGSAFGAVCRAKVELGYYAMVSGHSKFFPYLDANKRSAVRKEAETYLESVGGKPNRSNPASAINFIRYRDGFLNKKAPAWESETFSSVFHARRLPTGRTEEDGRPVFDVTPDYRIFSEGVKNVAETLNPLIGQDVYVHYINVPDPTFDADDPDTHTQYNHWFDAEGNPVANQIVKIVAVFKTEEEAVAYLEEHGESADASESEAPGGVDALFEQISGQVEMPEGFLSDEMWEEADYPDLLKGLVTALVSGKEVKEVVKDYAETPMDKKFIANVAKLVKEG